MKIDTFRLEEYLGKHEFTAPYLLCCSDAETWSVNEILNMATPQEKEMWEKLRLGYTEVRGLPALRATIAQELYPGLTAENILCFAGAQEGIFTSLFTLLEPKDHVIVIGPSYQSLLEVPKMVGCSITTINLQESNEWRIDIKAIASAIQSNTKMLIMNFPHNPTGQIITSHELEQLITLLKKHDIWLFSDEVYRLLGTTKTEWAPPAACVYDKAISLGVMSKAFGMPGLRVGWIACQDKAALDRIEKTKHYTSICNSALSEIISLIALRNKNAILDRNNTLVDQNLTLLDSFFEKHKNLFSWVRPQGGCIGFVKYHGKEPMDDFCERLVKDTGVLLLPGSVYSSEYNDYFRIGFGRANVPEILKIFEKFLK